jgi:multidrug efflux pump subunit AcrA (membrane-fusion protein)
MEQKPRRLWKWLVAAVVLAIAGVAGYQWSVARQQQNVDPRLLVRTGKVTIGSIERTVRIGGQTSAKHFTNISAPIFRSPDQGRDMVIMDLVSSGAMVKKGDVVAKIDGQAMQDHVDDLLDTVQASEADVRTMTATQSIEMETLMQTIRVAKANLDKAKLEAQASEVKTDIERELLKLAVDEADANYRQQLADVPQLQAKQKATLRILELTRERHMRHRARHIGDIERTTFRASIGGMAVMSPIFRGGEMGQFQKGDRVYAGMTFVKIVDPRSMQLEATVNQTESSEFRLGQEAKIHFDAFPGLEVKGKIYSLGALAVGGWRQNYFIRTLPVRLSIEVDDPRVIPDLSASADVVVARADNQVLVPRAALKNENGTTVLYVKKGGSFDRRQVKVGLQNETESAIVSGVHQGEDVRLN